MKLSTIIYKRYFTSQTTEGVHEKEGCFFQEQGKEDKQIRREISKKFELQEGLGFDGKVFYSFVIQDNLDTRRESSNREEYATRVYIYRAGESSYEIFPTDLGTYLTNHGFVKDKQA